MDDEEPDVVVDEDEMSVNKINEQLPEEVYVDDEDEKMVVGDEEYNIAELVTQFKSVAKKRGRATYGLTMGGVTLGLLISGPFAGVAGATAAGLIGAMYDRGHLEFTDDGIRLTIGEEAEYVDQDEVELTDPFEEYDDRWYKPDSDEYVRTVVLPDGDKRYYKTTEGAANRLVKEYGG